MHYVRLAKEIMSSCRKNLKSICSPPTRRLVTLEAMVREFIATNRAKEDEELAFYRNCPIEQALEFAALAKDAKEKRFSHQRRLTRASLQQGKQAIIGMQRSFQDAKSFDEVLQMVRSITSQVHGLGELYAYDTAIRILPKRDISQSKSTCTPALE